MLSDAARFRHQFGFILCLCFHKHRALLHPKLVSCEESRRNAVWELSIRRCRNREPLRGAARVLRSADSSESSGRGAQRSPLLCFSSWGGFSRSSGAGSTEEGIWQ